MKSIDKLIYDALVERRSIVLPDAGTLEVKRRGAKRISETQIEPPHNVVVFTTDEIGGGEKSIVPLVAADRGVSEDEAVAVYGSWLEGARRADGSIAIDGVGETTDAGGLVVAEGLNAALNPVAEDIVNVEARKRSIRPWIWIVIAVLAALLLAGLWCWKKTGFRCGGSRKTAVEAVVTPTTGSATDSLAATTATKSIAAGATTATISAEGRFNVIAGAFAIESNADNYIAKLKREYPELTPVKLVNPSNGYNMVSIFQTPTRREATRKMNLYWDVCPFLWIYEQK